MRNNGSNGWPQIHPLVTREPDRWASSRTYPTDYFLKKHLHSLFHKLDRCVPSVSSVPAICDCPWTRACSVQSRRQINCRTTGSLSTVECRAIFLCRSSTTNSRLICWKVFMCSRRSWFRILIVSDEKSLRLVTNLMGFTKCKMAKWGRIHSHHPWSIPNLCSIKEFGLLLKQGGEVPYRTN